MNAGVFEIASEDTGRNPEKIREYLDRLKALTVETGVPITYGTFASERAPEVWPPFLDIAREAAAEGGRIFVQVPAARSASCCHSDYHADGQAGRLELRAKPLAEQKAAFQDPAVRQQLIQAFENAPARWAPKRGGRTSIACS